MWIFEGAIEGAIVNRLIHDDDWTFNSMNTKRGSATFYTWSLKSLKSIH